MKTITLTAHAKLNLSLDILRKREDGYHDLRMVMQSISLHDDVTVEEVDGSGIRAATNLDYLPQDDKNLAVRAAHAFFAATGLPEVGLRITIEKRIPVCAGMAGGSTDAAAVLRALRALYAPHLTDGELERMGETVGSDVPYCVRGGTALAEGRGERLTTLPALPTCFVVVCKPAFSISTPELFGRVRVGELVLHPDTEGLCRALAAGELGGVARRMYNVFEDVLPGAYREVFSIRSRLLEGGALGAIMTGSGPTVFGLFQEETQAKAAFAALSAAYPQTFLEKTV